VGERPHQRLNPAPFAGSAAEAAVPIEAGAGESPR